MAPPPWTVLPLALATLLLGTLCLRAIRPTSGTRSTAGLLAAAVLGPGCTFVAFACITGVMRELRSGAPAPEGFYTFFVLGGFLVGRWPSIVTRWHRAAGPAHTALEIVADFTGLACAAAADAVLWAYTLPLVAGRGPSALLNAAFCVHAVTLLAVWAWMRRFYPPVPGTRGRGSQTVGALRYLAGIGLLLGAYHLPDVAWLAGHFRRENPEAIAIPVTLGLMVFLVPWVEHAWQQEEPAATTPA